MSWFNRRANKPAGMYNASSREYACVNCAYYANQICNMHKKTIEKPTKLKCGDFMRSDSAVPDFKEAAP